MKRTDLLDPDDIKTDLCTKRIGREVVLFKSTSSTNDIAAEYAANPANDGLVVFAEHQTAGRGRAGNQWCSGSSDSILCSIVLSDYQCGAELLSLMSAVAVAEAIGKIAGSEAKVKWPNDIYLKNKKIAGILLESKPNSRGTAHIIGIGINCHQEKESFAGELAGTATSIDIESGAVCDRVSLVRRLLTSLDHWLEVTGANGENVVDRWSQLSVQLGHRISVVYNGRKFTGHCTGLDPKKGLLLRLDTGGVRMFDAAHTSIAKD
jgi:BirA family biotin operon repressor/biotin-[acetyl-CoA-carboxylase] ligase